MPLKINFAEHPVARIYEADDGLVHVFNAFGDPWCNDDEEDEGRPISEGRNPGGDPESYDWCDECKRQSIEERLLVDVSD